MARRSNAEHSDATRQALLEGARRAFAEFGYADAPIENLVRGLGLTKGALYHHFGSKQGLFIAVAQAVEQDVMQRVRDAVPGQPITLVEFMAACRVCLEASLEPGVRRILLIDFPAVVGYRMTRDMEESSSIEPIRDALIEMLGAGEIENVDVESTAHLINGALYEAALWIGESPSPRAALNRALASLSQMLSSLLTDERKPKQKKR